MGTVGGDGDDAVIQLALCDPVLHRALLDQIDEGVCMVDRDHRILYWNRGAERISGYLAQEVAGQFSHGDLLIPCESDGILGPPLESEVAGVTARGEDRDSTVILRHREGHRLLAQLQSRPIRDAYGATVGAVEVFEEAVAPVTQLLHPLTDYDCLDPSTRAASRNYGEMMLRHALEAFHSFEIPFGWLRVGLDGAQDLDRGYGHAMVEAAVRMVAATLDRNLGSLDVLTRWGIADFRVEVTRCSRLELAAAAERLRLLVSASTLEWWGDRLRVTVSVGGATAEPGDTIESLEERVGYVYESCQASGGDRVAIAHLSGGRKE